MLVAVGGSSPSLLCLASSLRGLTKQAEAQMALSEFEIIKQFFDRVPERDDVLLSVGDDGAVVLPPNASELIVVTDTLVSGVHFPESTAAADVGFKSLAVNLSDVAAMGGKAAWATLALTLPDVSEDWIRGFSAGFFELASEHRIALVGGDLCRGPLSITVQLIGMVSPGKALKRSGALVGDDLYVTGTLGDARIGLAITLGKLSAEKTHSAFLCSRLNRPQPRAVVGAALVDIASALIDISDGLRADLDHVLEASAVGAELDTAALPCSDALRSVLSVEDANAAALAGGDDYELCFAAHPRHRERLMDISGESGCPITRIGAVVAERGIRYADGGDISVSPGYRHF